MVKNIFFTFRMTEEDRKNLDLVAVVMDRKPGDAIRLLVKNMAREFQTGDQVHLNNPPQGGTIGVRQAA